MSLPLDYLNYPKRQYGMDHDRYDWSMLSDRPPIIWPDNRPVAVWINISCQHFPLNQSGKPYAPPGGMSMPYPDLRHFTLRDYGNRVGIYRLLDALATRNIKASFAVNAVLCERAPMLVRELAAHGEIIGHSWHMDTLHHSGLSYEQESELVRRSLGTLREMTGQAITGWLSPARNESHQTPEILAENGIEFVADWVNDDMPFPFRTASGELIALPLSTELEDRFVVQNNLHAEASWSEQVSDAFQFLRAEAAQQGGRLLALSLHPWLIGQPHRMRHLEAVLDTICNNADSWNASPSDIVATWRAQLPQD